MNKYLEYTLVSPFPVGVGMQGHGNINRRKLNLAGWDQSYREKIYLCGNFTWISERHRRWKRFFLVNRTSFSKSDLQGSAIWAKNRYRVFVKRNQLGRGENGGELHILLRSCVGIYSVNSEERWDV